MYPIMNLKPYIQRKNSKKNKPASTNTTHLLLYILSLIIIINKISTATNSSVISSTTSIALLNTAEKLEALHSLSKLKSLRTKSIKFNQKQAHKVLIILMILLSNDVQQQPGPHPQEVKEYVGTSLQCTTCNSWTIITEETINNIRDGDFEWICPTPMCSPNHQPLSYQVTLTTSPNRYRILADQENGNIHTYQTKLPIKEIPKQDKSYPTEEESQNHELLKELPKISPKEYIGKDLCRKCFKEVRVHHRAVLCDQCNTWIHLKCSDMTTTVYNKNKTLESFKWVCNVCRVAEEPPEVTKFCKNKCSPEQLPETWDDLSKQIKKNEEIIIHFNARSIVEKGDEIQEICLKLKPALIFLTETWLDESCPKGTAVPEGYTIIRKDRSEEYKQLYGKTNGGGTAVIVRNGINMKKHSTLNKDDNEILWCTLTMKGKRHLFGLIYRAEYTTLLNTDGEGNTEMESLLQATQDYNLILIGDTNCDTSDSAPSKQTQTLLKITEEYGLHQQIKKPTRFNEKTETTIDHIFTRNQDLIKKTGTCEGISDHTGIYCIVNKEIDTKDDEEVRCRSFKNFDETQFQDDIVKHVNESSYNQHIMNKDVNSAFNTLLEVIKTVADEHAPWKHFKRGNKNKHIPWFNQELKDITERKNMYLKLYRLYRNPEDQQAYRAAKNKQTHTKRALKRQYYKEKIQNYDGDSKKIWSVLKQETSLDYREEITPDIINKDTANTFNNFFANVGIEVQRKLGINMETPDLSRTGDFKFRKETEERIEYLIKRIRPDVATGYDEISSRLLKAAAPSILTNLKDLINLSYETQIFPDALKKANVKALHKKGEYNNPAQYRPISILTTISKVFERSATEQIMDFYTKNNKLTTRQHAYRPHHSTTTCLFELTEAALKYIDEGYLVAIAALDLSKAFDSLSHDLILQKLLDMGIDGTAVKWIQSYLHQRKQVVKFGKIESDEELVESGVPQGSILGPLLFITCTNNIEEEMKDFEIFSYADDMQILVKGKTITELETQLETAIKTANSYYNRNSLLNNATKTEIMLLGSKQRLDKTRGLKVKVNEEGKQKYLYGEPYLKILGIYIDQSLNWNKHISHVKKKAVNSIRNIHRANKLLPMKQRRVLYNSLITPHFTYGDIIWNKCGRTNQNKIQQAQNYAAKSILGLNKYSSSQAALKKLDLLCLSQKRDIHAAVFVKKALDEKAPIEIQAKYNNQQRPSSLRQGRLQTPRHRTTLYETGAYYSSLQIWNSTPQDIKQTSLTQFRTKLQKHKLQQHAEA